MLEYFRLFSTHFAVIGAPVGSKGNQLAIGRVGTFGVITQGVGQVGAHAGIKIVGIHFEMLVVVPGITPLLARFAELDLLAHLVPRLRVAVGGCVQHPVTRGVNPGAGRFAVPRRHLLHVTGFQVHQEDLVERVLRVTLGLEDELRAVRGVIAFTGPATFKCELTGSFQEPIFFIVGGNSGQRQQAAKQQH